MQKHDTETHEFAGGEMKVKTLRPFNVLNYAGMASRAIEQQEALKRPNLAEMKAQARVEGLQAGSLGASRRLQLDAIMTEQVKADLDATRGDGNPVDYIIDDETGSYTRNEYAAEKGTEKANAMLIGVAIDKMYQRMQRGAIIEYMADQAEAQEAQEDRAAVKIDAAKQRRERKAAKRKGK